MLLQQPQVAPVAVDATFSTGFAFNSAVQADAVGNNITLAGGIAQVVGALGKALRIDSSSKSITSTHAASLTLGAWSFIYVFTQQGAPTNGGTVLHFAGTSGNANQIDIYTLSSGVIRADIYNSSGSPSTADSGTIAADGVYIAELVFDGSALQWWINGVKSGSPTSFSGVRSAEASAFVIGGASTGTLSNHDIFMAAFVPGARPELSANPWQIFLDPDNEIIVPAAVGIAFDAASNSGYQVAASTYTFNRTVSGANRFLAVDVSLMGTAGTTVTSVTDDSTGAAIPMTLIGTSSNGTRRVETWGLVAPSTGTKTIAVTLSAAINSAALATSYTGVHQSAPTEAFNSATGTNAGTATDASVVVTSIADLCWIHGAIATDALAITANQTTRNNVSGALGSGADEDNNAAKTPAGTVTMSYTGLGITSAWAMGGYAIRPVSAAATVYSMSTVKGVYTLTGNSSNLTAARKVAAVTGVYTLTGISLATKISRKMTAAVGSYSLTGNNVVFTYTPSGTATYTLTAVKGAYTLTGISANVTAARKLVLTVGSFSLTGFSTALQIARKLSLTTGSYVETGISANLKVARVLAASVGNYVLTGYALAGGPVVTVFRATILKNGIMNKITTAQLGTGLKPIVYVSDHYRQRNASEGTPLIFDPIINRWRLLRAGETLEV